MPVTIRRFVFAAILAVWLASLAQPVAITQRGTPYDGFAIGFIGPLGMLIGHFGWWANLWLPVAVIRGWRGSAQRTQHPSIDHVIGIVLTLLTINSLFWNDIPTDAGSDRIVRYGLGYHLWLAAVAGAGIATLYERIRRKPR